MSTTPNAPDRFDRNTRRSLSHLLDGQPLNGTRPEDCGRFAGEIEAVADALPGERANLLDALRRANPALGRLAEGREGRKGASATPLFGFDKPPPLRWTVAGLVPEGFVSLLAADGGTGKSFLAVYLSLCVCMGLSFFGLGTRRGPRGCARGRRRSRLRRGRCAARRRRARAAGLGLNAQDCRPPRTGWGLNPKKDKRDGGCVWLPRGIVIPWWSCGGADAHLWKVNIRRPDGDVKKAGGPKYVQAAGKKASEGEAPAWETNAFYGASALRPGEPAVLVEGELDALAIMQEARTQGRPLYGTLAESRPLAAAVATGSTGGARRPRWIGKLAGCCPVLLAFDAEKAGEGAARYWLDLFPERARRHAPQGAKDAAAMLEAGRDVRAWIRGGLPQRAAEVA